MAWDSVDLRTHDGLPVPPSDRTTILDLAGKAIVESDRDPDVVIRAAVRVGRKLHVIENLRAYATRAISRAVKKADGVERKKNRSVYARDMETIADHSQAGKIENDILVRELLATREPLDREIFARRMSGDTFPEIDSDMNLKPRTAERRFRICRAALREVLDDTLDRRTSSRGQ